MNRMKIDRMFKIIYLLMSRDKMTAKELAEHFEVSVRTIHRDIDSLMQAGVPVYTSRGSEGGVSLVDGFVLDKAVLSKDEQAEILFGLQSLPGCATGEDVLGKLGVLFGRSGPDRTNTFCSNWFSSPLLQQGCTTNSTSTPSSRRMRAGFTCSPDIPTENTSTICSHRLEAPSKWCSLQRFGRNSNKGSDPLPHI
ncbi:helix-turn-helix transcriptional regulator [Raoultibacter massiliensis]|uniref:HTH domain-containing protein n=1 Tax=Raoultibacter massiliensis TaxID=1852371 RepID=A0ABV1JG75_9ACTN